jgi:hypothetical protein
MSADEDDRCLVSTGLSGAGSSSSQLPLALAVLCPEPLCELPAASADFSGLLSAWPRRDFISCCHGGCAASPTSVDEKLLSH